MMKELESNQKVNAHWKTWAFLVFVLAMGITFLAATHGNYADTGDNILESTKAQIAKETKAWETAKQRLIKEKKELNVKLKNCKNDNNPRAQLEDCQSEVELIQVDIDDAKQRLTLCNNNLNAAKLNN